MLTLLRPLFLAAVLVSLTGCQQVIEGGLKGLLAGPHAIEYARCGSDLVGPSARALALSQQTQHGLGAQLGTSQPIAFLGSSRQLAALATGQVDLRPLCPPVYSQGPVQSCTGFAVAKGLAEFLLLRGGTPTPCSAMYSYTEARRYSFMCAQGLKIGPLLDDTGAPVSAAMQAFATTGAAAESVWPYLPATGWSDYAKEFGPGTSISSRSSNTGPNPAGEWFGGTTAALTARSVFKPAKIVPIVDLPALKASLDRRLPVVFGMRIFEGFYADAATQTGLIPLPGQDERDLGGHAVLCVGYDDTKARLIVRNSWGPTWGDHGYFYLPYAYLQRGYVRDGWSVADTSAAQ